MFLVKPTAGVNNSEKAGNDVINIFTCEAEDMENTALAPGCSFDKFYECCTTIIS